MTALEFMQKVLEQGRNNYKRAQKKPGVTEGELESIRRKTGYYEEAVAALEKHGQHPKHYILINEWAFAGSCGRDVVGVAHTEEEMQKLFADAERKERSFASGVGWEISKKSDGFTFEASSPDNYFEAHTCLIVEELIGN